MAKLRKLLALALVMAMTFSMLPVFAAAEDGVGEVVAVEPVAVEDVAEISAAPDEAPVADAIATAPTETVAVKAVLQVTISDGDEVPSSMTDTELVATYENAIWRAIAPDGTNTVYTSVAAAINEANTWTETGGVIRLLKDYTLSHPTSVKASTTPYYQISPNTNNYSTDEDPLVGTLYGYWIDLGNHTLTAKMTRPLFGNVANGAAVNIRNGYIFYWNYTGTQFLKGVVTFGASNAAPCSSGTDVSTLKTARVTFYNVEAVNISTYADGNAIGGKDAIASALWKNDFRFYDSKIISAYSSGVGFIRSNPTTALDSDELNAAGGVQYNIELHGNSVVGSLGLATSANNPNFCTQAIRFQSYNTKNTDKNWSDDHVLTVTADATSKFLGTDLVFARSGSPELTVNAPAGLKTSFDNYAYAMPDRDNYPAAGAGAPPRAASVNYSGFYYAAHTHGENVTSHPAEAATFAAAGHSAYYECDCGQLFTDAACTVPTTLEEVTTAAKLVDASGYTDAELVELGAVIRATAPNAATDKAYDNIPDGYEEANTWTEAGGTLKLLTDVTIYMDGPATTGGYLTPTTYDYSNNEVAGIATTGFWFDLDGHTINATIPKSLFFTNNASGVVNMKNGTVIFTDNGRTTNSGGRISVYGVFDVGGNSSTSADVISSINLYQINCYALTGGKTSVPTVIAGYAPTTTVNVKESTLITNGDEPAIKISRSKASTDGVNIQVNITGGSTVGTLDGTMNAVYFGDADSTGAFSSSSYSINVNADSDTTFLGNAAVAAAESISGHYTINQPTFACMTRSLAFPAIGLAAADYKVCVDPSAAGLTTDDPTAAKATLTYGGNTVYFNEISDALAYAEITGTTFATTVTLNAAATATYALGSNGQSSAFTLDLNGQTLPAAGLFDPSAASGKTVTVTMDGAGTAKLFVGAPALTFVDADSFVVNEGSMFSSYSLNLEDNVSINFYTEDNAADTVYYVQDDTDYTIANADIYGAWVVKTLAAKQMFEEIDAYAFQKNGTVTTIDFIKNASVKGYVETNPAQYVDPENQMTVEQKAAVVDALNATLKTMLIYGKYAEKYFDGNGNEELTPVDMAAIGITEIPVTVTDFNHIERTVNGMGNYQEDSNFVSGFVGTSAVLEDSINLQFYFYGDQFDGATATVSVGGGAPTAATIETNGNFKYVKTSVTAKNFDTAITVAIDGVGSVTDSVEAYTARVLASTDPENVEAQKLAQALRNYGADAMRYDAAKNP